MKNIILLFVLQISFSTILNGQQAKHSVQVKSWLTTHNGGQKLASQPDIYSSEYTGSPGDTVTIFVDDQITYQSMDGFGAAMTGTSAYVLNRYLNNKQRDSVMSELFGSSGLRLSFIRQMIGGSGYEVGGDYSYNDMPAGKTDTTLAKFSIDMDKADIIPMLKLALSKNSSIKIFGSPCSAPGWMKNTGSMRGTDNSYLLNRYYGIYANYFVKYIKAYKAEKVPIWGITIQNEPEFGPTTYPGMLMSAKEQADFIKNNLGPAFVKNKIDTRIIIFDHNWAPQISGFQYSIDVLDDKDAKKYIAGSGFHNYAGDASLQTFVHDKHPDKDIWFTEGSGGEWVGDFGANMKEFVSRITIGSIRNWSKGICLWNLVLDKDNLLQKAKKPEDQNCAACYGIVMIDTLGNVTRMPEYYAIAHSSKFVIDGAVRIASNSYTNGIENVAFKNPDGSMVLLAINSGKTTSVFKVRWGSQLFRYTLGAGDVATFTWSR